MTRNQAEELVTDLLSACVWYEYSKPPRRKAREELIEAKEAIVLALINGEFPGQQNRYRDAEGEPHGAAMTAPPVEQSPLSREPLQ